MPYPYFIAYFIFSSIICREGESKDVDESEQKDNEDEKNGIEMSDDFDGKASDPRGADEQSDGDDEDEEDEDLDKQMGDFDEQADALDEQVPLPSLSRFSYRMRRPIVDYNLPLFRSGVAIVKKMTI